MSVRSGRGMGLARYHGSPFRRKERPLVWAHRGASRDALENTLAAFEQAERQGADGIECDVRLCKSGELVVFHDERLARLAGLPVAVRDLRYEDLASVALRDPATGHEGRIPTLDEAMAAVSPQMLWNVELKVDRHEQAEPLARAMVAWLRRTERADRVLVSSFHPLAILTCRRLAPELATAYVFEPDGFNALWHGFWLRTAASAAVHPPVEAVRKSRVERWQRLGLCVNPWVSNDADEMRRLADAGVDGIITDVPALALQVLSGDGPSWTSTGRKSAASQETSR